MIGKKIVIALGGNALGKTPSEQLELVKITAKYIVELVMAGNKIVITHGNGPQVGMINLAHDIAHKNGEVEMNFPECGAMSQGYIGYHLQQAIQLELKKKKRKRGCATVVTQVLVDETDPAFLSPTKPIGSFFTKEEADKKSKESGYTFINDANRGYRRVVPSPKPLNVLELNVIKDLVRTRHVVIACGGGGVPVIFKDNRYQGVDAVIDKDMTSARLAIDLKVDVLLILTAVPEVKINFGTDQEKKLSKLTYAEAKKYSEAGEFAPGSMLPKIEAAMKFVKYNRRGKVIITSLENAKKALQGKKGTTIKYGGMF